MQQWVVRDGRLEGLETSKRAFLAPDAHLHFECLRNNRVSHGPVAKKFIRSYLPGTKQK